MPVVNVGNNRADTNCASSFCFCRVANQKSAASAGGKTSNSQSKFGCSNLMAASEK
jgi:hypothetical protein